MTFSTTDFGYFLILETGDELVRSLIQFGRQQEVDAAMLTGVGSVAEVELGTGAGRAQRRTLLREPLDVCALTGTLTLMDGEPFPHLHGSFARADHSVVGGHIYQAVCDTTLEIAVQLIAPAALTRPRTPVIYT